MAKPKYVEPENYFSDEIMRKYKLGEYDDGKDIEPETDDPIREYIQGDKE